MIKIKELIVLQTEQTKLQSKGEIVAFKVFIINKELAYNTGHDMT